MFVTSLNNRGTAATATWLCYPYVAMRRSRTSRRWRHVASGMFGSQDSTTPLKQLTDDERALRAVRVRVGVARHAGVSAELTPVLHPLTQPKRGYNWFSGAAKGSKGSGSCSTASRYKNRDSAVLHIKTRCVGERRLWVHDWVHDCRGLIARWGWRRTSLCWLAGRQPAFFT